MSTKTKFVGAGISGADTLAKLARDLADFVEVYFDRGYDSGGADPIIDADITDLNKTASEVGNLVTLAQQYAKFVGNSAVTTADYGATISGMRQDL